MPIYKMTGQKDGKQKYRVRINYSDATGKARQMDRVVFGYEEAKYYELQLSRDMRQEPQSSNLTIRQLFDEYTSVKKHEIRESTLDKSERILKYHVLPTFQDVSIAQLTPKAVQNWKLGMEQKALSLKTKQNAYGEFRAMLNYAVKMEYLMKNPLTRIGNFRNASEMAPEMRYYTAEEFKAFAAKALEYAQDSPLNKAWDYYVFFCIAFYTGLRKGEIHALKWTDIDNGYLYVRRSITQKLKGEDRETPPKNKASIRVLQMPQPLIDILDEHKKRYQAFEQFSPEWRVCGGLRPLRDTSIQNMNAKFASAAGQNAIRIHDFRHSHVSLLANEGINIQEIARRLGHAKIDMTWNTYSHLYPREEERAVEVLNKVK